MRTKPLLGTKAWFGPRRFGWGWGPVSWEGVVVALAILAAIVAVEVLTDESYWSSVLVGAVLTLCVLKGTSPGGPRRLEEFKRHRAKTQNYVRGGGDDTPHLDDVVRNWDARGGRRRKQS